LHKMRGQRVDLPFVHNRSAIFPKQRDSAFDNLESRRFPAARLIEKSSRGRGEAVALAAQNSIKT
jgi:hypothetical protein